MKLQLSNTRKPGVCYAPTEEGVELPVIDVTHPAFRLELGAGELESRLQAHLRMLRRRERMPAWLVRLLARFASHRSVLVRGIVSSEGGFFSGMNTYLLKLGSANLVPGCSGRIDRKLADSFPALAARPSAPLHFVNIAGGPASDSLNALILLKRDHPEWL